MWVRGIRSNLDGGRWLDVARSCGTLGMFLLHCVSVPGFLGGRVGAWRNLSADLLSGLGVKPLLCRFKVTQLVHTRRPLPCRAHTWPWGLPQTSCKQLVWHSKVRCGAWDRRCFNLDVELATLPGREWPPLRSLFVLLLIYTWHCLERRVYPSGLTVGRK